jgi:hypothetical protein
MSGNSDENGPKTAKTGKSAENHQSHTTLGCAAGLRNTQPEPFRLRRNPTKKHIEFGLSRQR